MKTFLKLSCAPGLLPLLGLHVSHHLAIVLILRESAIAALTLFSSVDSNGSYFYQNDNGSKYFNSGTGFSKYTPP